ncbi:hypothetical protein M409DRAFT_56136 [Zasmidium cellare ATCC 36951]|uniref:DUF4440 domain-containing protein n=1 Tax=Zasmidium cellare ATCC 36951 TaxID=1080233 RepID=A0A6A6CHV2_ZASCE|nr:uncharacterized protein M409DRAFT_56136 [Zasmidium cellare ATCC 36951]KAF2165269.1 hypothetical protein M409DRAFT_56136 [Zasmidium cellare ATCC 36951]
MADSSSTPESTNTSSDSTQSPKPPPSLIKKPLTSLDILSPPSTTPSLKPPKCPTALFLESLHHHIVSALNARDFENPLLTTHLSPNMAAYMEFTSSPYVTTREAFINRYRTLVAENVNYRFELAEVEASVDEAKGKALVWFKLRIWGHPEGVEREGVYVNMWKRIRGQWICERQNGVRGVKVGEGIE